MGMLEKFGMSSQEFGKNLIEAAQQQNQKALIDYAVGEVSNLNNMIDHCERNIELSRKAIAVYRKRLAAIEAGKFTINRGGSINNPQTIGHIVYHDPALNEIV